ncbi:TonB-dependent receptor [Flavilitoribacter nigricans]|uniref:Uncharacterized protein n=1 Tax=Flavilitoribacter nigricans (strain ATCC 23147 / DSM 23189 / NBRC 102662 / NCIMB 1420 / SS-2) TaxID=1122177 RepID=A0A2D0N2F8_FLAN2|nr:TonB-dependent receptor [Flavilitoribacter nigricans]PHN02637.1 hypothetical protein CRP01_31070 [Flavilitoribacter nigricans DSM 23189 = NBRC 102662]
MWKPGIILLLLLSFTVVVRAQIADVYPPISIASESIRVAEVLDQITRQTGVKFTYNPRSIDPEQQIAFTVNRASLETTLRTLSEAIPIRYQLIKDQIVLTPDEREPELLTLSGFIEDQNSGESLIGATASIPGTSRGTVTNAFGYYALPLERGERRLNYSYIGYQQKEMDLTLRNDQRQNIALQPRALDLPSVIVELPKLGMLDKRDLGKVAMDPARLNNMPEFGGESGLVKGLQSLPGIKMHSDGSAFFYTRGGERDQNLIIVDDAPIYNPSHLFGFYSIIIPDFAKSIEVYKSDFPANLGDRLSSIINIRTRDGNLNKLEFSGALNPLINRFALEAPIVKQRSSIFVSWRRSNFEWLYQRAAPNADLGFGDFSLKWNHKLNPNNRLYLTAITSLDNFTNSASGTNAGIRWGNLAATLRWNHIFNPRLFANTTLYTGNYAYRLFQEPNYWQSALGTLSLKTDFTKYNSPRVTSRFGLELQAYFIDPGSASVDSSIAILPEIRPNYSRKTVAYYQGEFELSERVQLSAGARLISWANSGPATYYEFGEDYAVTDTIRAAEEIYNRYVNLDPRLSLRYRIDSSAQVKLSVGRYHQYLQLISNATSPFNSFEVWLPASPNIRPQAAWQFALNYSKYLRPSQLEFSAALYYKKLDNQIDYQPHATTLLNPLVEGELRFGSMEAYGLELMLEKKLGRLSGWLAYTYSRSLRKTPDLNGGRIYPAFQDRPHDLSLLLNYQLAPRALFSFYYTAYSGSTFSSPTGFYTYNDQTVPVYAEKNNDRLPAYRRMDIAFKFRLNKDETRRFRHYLTFSIYNASAHKNIVAVNFNKFSREEGRPLVKSDLLSEVPLSPSQIDLIRFFPSLTYQFKL